MSLDSAIVDLSKSFERGMGYVALSRVRSLSGLKLLGLNENALLVHEEVLYVDKKLERQSQEFGKYISALSRQEKEEMQASFIKMISPLPKDVKRKKVSTEEETKSLIKAGLSLEAIATKRKLTTSTILGHFEELAKSGLIDPEAELKYLKPTPLRYAKIRAAFERVLKKNGEMLLSPTRNILGQNYSFHELRLARIFLSVKPVKR